LLTLFVFLCPYAATYALTPEQCEYFSRGGKTAVCHATGSAKNPFELVRVSVEACVKGHSDHSEDFVAFDDSCQAGSCLPAGSPCDATLGCCEGLACSNGVCSETEPVLLVCK
jgi:hypothetical protein